MSLDMKNIYYTEEYQNHVSEYDWLYQSEPESVKTYSLDDRFTVEVCSYVQEKANDKGSVWRWKADKVCITDGDGNILTEYKSVGYGNRFTKIIKHNNGHEYLLFSTDLYGYSVMDLNTREVFSYFPSCSLYRTSFEETFIWCDSIHYNTENNLLAVGGCYWAAPSGVLLVDFENPMKESSWADTHAYLDPIYELYDDIDFKQWDGENLVLQFTAEANKEIRTFSPDVYMKWFEPIEQMKIRVMTIDDYDGVYRLWMNTPGMGLNNLDDSKDGIRKYLLRNPETCFVAESDGEIIGVIMSGHDGRRGLIHHTAVKVSERGQGIGSKLVDHAMNALSNEGINKVILVVFEKNETGNSFWEKRGFTKREDLIYRNKSINELERIDT